MNIAVAQSGGPTCAINSSLLGVIKGALGSDKIDTIYGAVNGIEGIINQNLIDLTAASKEYDLELLRQTPSSALGSCRYKLPDFSKEPAVLQKIIDCFKAFGIEAFFYIGGNDSMDTVYKLSKHFMANGIDIKVMGVPKTIDNDLCETDHTPGFGSAAKYVSTTIKEVIRDSSVYDMKSVTIIEIMGRNAGWLTASACLLHKSEVAPHLIYLPECDFSLAKFISDIEKVQKTHQSVIVALSEGVKISDANMSTEGAAVDSFGHTMLGGVGKFLENEVKKALGCKVRSIELNVMQRAGSHISSLTDIDEAEKVGTAAVKAMLKGETGKMMAFKRVSNDPYKVNIEPADASMVANHEKMFPKEWINAEQNNIEDEAISYFAPLIMGEQNIKTEDGLPVHLVFKGLLK